MIRRRGKDRGEIQAVNAHRLKVIQPIDHPIEITPLKPFLSGISPPGFELQMLLGLNPCATTETIRKDLVNHRLSDPSRRVGKQCGQAHNLSRWRSSR